MPETGGNPYWHAVRALAWESDDGPARTYARDRRRCCRRYSWAIPSPRALRWISKVPHGRRPLAAGAGTGYWAWQLQQAGMDVLPCDRVLPVGGFVPIVNLKGMEGLMSSTSSLVDAVSGRLGGGALAAARFCVIFPVIFIAVYVVGGLLLPDVLIPFWVWLDPAVLSGAIVGLLFIFIKHPWHSRRPAGLMHALSVSVVLVLPALVVAFWPAVIAVFLTPLLVGGSAIIEWVRRV